MSETEPFITSRHPTVVNKNQSGFFSTDPKNFSLIVLYNSVDFSTFNIAFYLCIRM